MTINTITNNQITDLEMVYIESPPNKWTFEPPKIKQFVESQLEGAVLNLFAGKTKLRHDEKIVRVDIDTDRDAKYHFDALELDEHFRDNYFNTVILDPPYNIRKGREQYNGVYQGKFNIIKNKVRDIVKPGGKVVTFGYSSTGMSRSRGFTKELIGLVNHKGDHDDTIIVVERKVNRDLGEFVQPGVSEFLNDDQGDDRFTNN